MSEKVWFVVERTQIGEQPTLYYGVLPGRLRNPKTSNAIHLRELSDVETPELMALYRAYRGEKAA